MATSIDKVLQPDGSYRWQMVDSWDPMSERKHQKAAQQAAEKAAKPAKKTKAKKVAEPAEEPVNVEPPTESAPEA